MSDQNFDRLTKADLIELLKASLTKKDLNANDVRYDPSVDFPERLEHWAQKAEKQRIFNNTRGKGLKGLKEESKK